MFPGTVGIAGAAPSPVKISLGVSSPYSNSVPPGAWVPVTVTVADRGSAQFQGQVLVTSPVSEVASGPGAQACYRSGPNGVYCFGTGIIGGGFSGGYNGQAQLSVVTYRLPLDLAPGTSKTLTVDVMADEDQDIVTARAEDGAGDALAKASLQLSVDNGTELPTVLVVTDEPGLLSAFPVPLPDSSNGQLQLLSPGQLPASSSALGSFSAIIVDQADTSGLSPSQGRALEGYVQAGGTLVLAGGIGWPAVGAGIPQGLVPVRVGTARPMALPELARLLGAPRLGAPVEVDRVQPQAGGSVVLDEGGTPLAVEAPRGDGEVVFSAADPASAPLLGWSGLPDLLGRLLAGAYEKTLYPVQASLQAGGHAVGGSVVPAITVPGPSAPAGQLESGTAPMSPAFASGAMSAYLAQAPGTAPPTAHMLGLLLLGYVALTGPVCFFVLRRLRRRDLMWGAVPCVALVATVAAYATGAGMARSPVTDEIDVALLAPGSHMAQVSSLGGVYLPQGGAVHVVLSGSGPVTDLGADAGADLTVSPGGPASPGDQATTLNLAGAVDSFGGWAASEDTEVRGTFRAEVRVGASGDLTGTLTNALGARLTDVAVVVGNGAVAELSDLAPGQSAHFSVGPPANGPYQGQVVLGSQAAAGTAAARRQAVDAGLLSLGAQYAQAYNGSPVLVALADRPFFTPSAGSTVKAADQVDALVVPLVPSVPPGRAISGEAPELVGSKMVTDDGVGADQPQGGSAGLVITLAAGGSLDYQFSLPGTRWQALRVDLGSPTGSANSGMADEGVGISSGGTGTGTTPVATRDLALAAFDYRTSDWVRLHLARASGHLLALIPLPANFLGPTGTVELRLTALVPGLTLAGPVPALSAQP